MNRVKNSAELVERNFLKFILENRSENREIQTTNDLEQQVSGLYIRWGNDDGFFDDNNYYRLGLLMTFDGKNFLVYFLIILI